MSCRSDGAPPFAEVDSDFVNRFKHARSADDAWILTRTNNELKRTYRKHEGWIMIVARKVAAGIAEIASLGLFLGMVWVWAALFCAPGI
jgi:hypothetical protein